MQTILTNFVKLRKWCFPEFAFSLSVSEMAKIMVKSLVYIHVNKLRLFGYDGRDKTVSFQKSRAAFTLVLPSIIMNVSQRLW